MEAAGWVGRRSGIMAAESGQKAGREAGLQEIEFYIFAYGQNLVEEAETGNSPAKAMP